MIDLIMSLSDWEDGVLYLKFCNSFDTSRFIIRLILKCIFLILAPMLPTSASRCQFPTDCALCDTNSKCYWQQVGNQPILPKPNWIKFSTHHYSQNLLSHIGHVVVNNDVPTNQQQDVLTGLRFTFQDLDI